MLTSMFVSIALAWTCPEEQQRVRAHLEGAYTQLTTSEPTGLTPTQRQARERALQVLRDYIDRGVYPHNPGHPLTPIFVDASGTRCAMGELLAKLGGHAIVEHVRHTRNLATVGVLADEPGLLEWLAANGLTPEEAALVQPTYSQCGAERLEWTCGTWAMPPIAAGLARSSEDGPVELQRLLGALNAPTLRRDVWPLGTPYLWSSATPGDRRFLVKRGARWVSPVDATCGAAPTLSEADARRVILEAPLECARSLLRIDPRWALHACTRYSVGYLNDRSEGEPLCDASGALRRDSVSPRAQAEAWLQANGLSDASVDLSGYDGWLTERPGPPVLEPVVLEAPPALPLQSGCSEAPGLAIVATVISFAWKRRRTPPLAVRSR